MMNAVGRVFSWISKHIGICAMWASYSETNRSSLKLQVFAAKFRV